MKSAWLFLLLAIGRGAWARESERAIPLPFEVENRKNLKWDERKAAKIYAAASRVLVQEVNPEHPKAIEPKLTLILGAKHAHGECVEGESGGHHTIWLNKWDEEKFAYGVVKATSDQLVDAQTQAHLARRAVQAVNAMVDVKELAGGKNER